MFDLETYSCGTTFLLCHNCGHNYHHLGKVETFFRDKEDSHKGLHVTATSSQLTINKDTNSNNPSSRRDGVIIYFYCENCEEGSNLAIIHHKGHTLLEWL
jgi:hypothetical protein